MFRSARVAILVIGCLACLSPTASEAAPTRIEDERLLSAPSAPGWSALGTTLAMSRNSERAFALAGAPLGGTGIGAVEAFRHFPGQGWGSPVTQLATAGTSCACPVDIEMLRWFEEELGVLAYREISTTTDLRWWVPTGGGSLAPSVFGAPVESVAIFDETLVVGQPRYLYSKGRILIYERGDDGFALVATFVGTNAGEKLGTAVAVGPARVMAGAPDASPNGVVRTYVRTDRWVPWLTIASPATSQTAARFGAALSLSLDGNLLAVGSPYVDKLTVLPGGTPKYDVGAVYLYRPIYLGWELTTLLRPLAATNGDKFGSSVALHRDVVVAGSPGEGVPIGSAGAAYVFEHLGSRWTETWRLSDSVPQLRAHLGTSVAVGDLGVMAGAPRYDSHGVYDQGAVLFYAGVEQDADDD